MQDYINISRSIKVSSSELLITHAFAEKVLSKEALGLATKTSTHYVWVNGQTAGAIYFELPKTFKVPFYTLLPMLTNYCPNYMRALGLNDNVIYQKYINNYENGKDYSTIKNPDWFSSN